MFLKKLVLYGSRMTYFQEFIQGEGEQGYHLPKATKRHWKHRDYHTYGKEVIDSTTTLKHWRQFKDKIICSVLPCSSSLSP